MSTLLGGGGGAAIEAQIDALTAVLLGFGPGVRGVPSYNMFSVCKHIITRLVYMKLFFVLKNTSPCFKRVRVDGLAAWHAVGAGWCCAWRMRNTWTKTPCEHDPP